MSVYMQPLIDELESVWNDGVRTYDRATRTNFKMHVWYMYSKHDHPTYGLFRGWCVHGKLPCVTPGLKGKSECKNTCAPGSSYRHASTK
jgi:hypothetical protein